MMKAVAATSADYADALFRQAWVGDDDALSLEAL